MATINEMRQVATQIENETQVGGNTAIRVGGLFNDIVDKLEDDETDINIVQRVEITYKQCQIPNKYINDTNVGSALSLQSNNDYGVFYFFVRKGQSFAISSTYVAPSASRLYIFHLDEDLDIVQRYENVVVGTTTYTATEDCIVVGTLYGNDSVQYTGIQKAYLVNGKTNEVGLTGANIIQHLKDLEDNIDNDITNLNTEVGALEDEVFGTPSVSNLPLPNDGVLNANGTISLYEDWYNSDYFAVDSAKQYTYNGSIYGGGNILYYDSAKNLLGACSNIPANYADRTNPVELNDMPSNAAYIRVSGYDISACSITESDSLRPKVENMEERLDNLIKPQGIIEPVFGATLANPVRIKLLGDSITQGWGGSNFDQDGAEIYPLGEGWQTHRNLHGYCWANMMRDYLETKYHCTVVNNAITGTSTRNIVTRLDDFIDVADDIVICAYGTNNRNNYDGNNTEWNSFVSDLFTIVNYCKERNKTIILVANIPASSANEQSTDNGHAKSAHMNDVHDAVLYVAESTGVECVDMYDAFNDYCINTNTPLGALLGDGLHPNDNGYDVYYSLIMPMIGVAIESAAESGGVIDGNSTTIKVRRNTAAGFTSSNPVLADGELGFETDQKRYKMGDGVTAWKTLEYRSEELDTTPTQGSTNGVTSGGVFSEFVDYSLKSGVSVPLVWYAGSLNPNHVYLSSTTRIIATCPAQEMAVKIASGYWCSIHEYSTELGDANTINDGSSWMGNTYPWFDGGAFITPSAGAKSFVFILAKGNKTENISTSEGSNCDAKFSVVGEVEKINGVLYGTPSGIITETAIMEQGGLNPDGKKSPSSAAVHNYRIRTANPIRVKGEFTVRITGSYYFNIHFYQTSDLSTWVSAYVQGGWVTGGSATTEWDGYIMLIAKSSSDAALNPSSTTLTLTQDKYEKGLIEEVEELTTDTENYAYGADMMKKEIKVDEIGNIYYGQAFCVYNGHFFSTDGSHIAEQDENLSLVRTASVNVGHGNSFQLVSNGKVWASGWNDQKMYKVDLSTLTIEQTITLPTTGYTTAAVDEDGGKMYILQRDTNPNYIGQYTWMVYDIQTGVIESTRKIDSFAALQSMDYYRGKIFMLYGIVPPDAPSGMRVYNTNGDVLAEFKIKVFANTEPEGICFDEDTYTLYVSNQPKKLFKITAK